MAPQIAPDVASRVRFALTQVVLGIDFSRSAVPTHSSPAVVSTEPALRLANPHAGGTRKSRTLTPIIAKTLFAVLAIPVQLAAQQTTTGTNGQIAFAQITTDGPANVFIANSDGSNVQQVPLVNPAEAFGVPVWSPDSTKLLISHTIRLDSAGQCCLFQPATVDLNGSNFNQLMPPNPPGASANADCGAWYPDGTRLLCGFTGDQPGIFSIRASDGGDPVRLTTNPYGPGELLDAATDI